MRLAISGIRDFYVVPGSELDYLVDVMVCDKTDGELAERILVDDSDVEMDEEGGIPFSVVLPKAANSVNADMMSVTQIHQKLEKGYADIEKGNVEDAASIRHFPGTI